MVGDLWVRDVTRSHVIHFKDAMAVFPRNLTRLISNLSVPEIITRTKNNASIRRLRSK